MSVVKKWISAIKNWKLWVGTLVATIGVIFAVGDCSTAVQKKELFDAVSAAVTKITGIPVTSVAYSSLKCKTYDHGPWENKASLCIKSGKNYFSVKASMEGGKKSVTDKLSIGDIKPTPFCFGLP